MKFLRNNMQTQFMPSNYELSQEDMPKSDTTSTAKRTTEDAWDIVKIDTHDIHDFKIPNMNNRRRGIFATNFTPHSTPAKEDATEVRFNAETRLNYDQYNYDDVECKSQVDLLWSGPQWQVEKLLMDIGFANINGVKLQSNNDYIVGMYLLNNGQDGSLREQMLWRSKHINVIMYNYPDQSTDEPSTLEFICKQSGELYYIEILIADFSITLDIPVNPFKFSAEYLRRVLLIGGKFIVNRKSINKKPSREQINPNRDRNIKEQI
jgi:hypothetical protein